jgi:hypothetical protein
MTRVVDVSNSASFEDVAVMKFLEASTRNLLAQEAAAGVRHHVALSVVGTERLSESGYFRAKIAQEKLIKGSSSLYSIAVFRIPEAACRHFLRRQEGAFAGCAVQSELRVTETARSTLLSGLNWRKLLKRLSSGRKLPARARESFATWSIRFRQRGA